MLSEELKKYLDLNTHEVMTNNQYVLLKDVYKALVDYEQKEFKDLKFNKAGKLAKKCFEQAWDIATSRVMPDDVRYELIIKLCQMMMCHIRETKRIKALSPLLGYFKPKITTDVGGIIREWSGTKEYEDFLHKIIDSADDPIERGDQGQQEKRIKVEFEDQDEKPDITSCSIRNLQNTMNEESGGSLSMDVLCYDDTAHLGLVKEVKRVLYTREKIKGDYFVCRIVEKAESGGPITKSGLLISS